MNIQQIKMLISRFNPKTNWMREFESLLTENDVFLSSEAPGQMTAKDVLADARIHRQTTSRANIQCYGLDNLITTIETIPPTQTILISGVVGKSKRGILYYTTDSRILGGVVLSHKTTA